MFHLVRGYEKLTTEIIDLQFWYETQNCVGRISRDIGQRYISHSVRQFRTEISRSAIGRGARWSLNRTTVEIK